MKRWTAGVIVTLILVLCAGGCGGRTQASQEERTEDAFTEPQYDWGGITGQTLEVWGNYPDLERGYITKAFDRYRELTGNSLTVVQMPKEEFREKLIRAFDGKAKGPDVILSYGGTSLEAFDPDKNFYDFSDAVWLEDLTDTSINQTVYNGKVIGLPHWEASVSGALYNKKLFEKYDLAIPGSQKEFMELCQTLAAQGITPMYMPGKEISMLLYQFPLDSVVEDPKILEGLNDGSLGYQDLLEMEEIVTWYKTMADRGYFGDTYMTDGWDGMSPAMESGKYAMMLCWDTWLYTDFQGNPEDFGLMPAFMGVPGAGTFEGPNLGLFIVNRNSERLDAAVDFITFLADPYNYNAAFEGVYTAPVFKNQAASISTPQYLAQERLIDRNFRDSTAWLRIRGFSQMDASCILEYMSSGEGKTARDCLREMDMLRAARLEQ